MPDAREPAVWCEPVEALRDTGPGAFRLNRAERTRPVTGDAPYDERGTERRPGDRRRNQGGNTFSRP